MEDIKAAKKELRAAMKILLKGVAREDAERASLGVLAELESLEQWKNSDLVLAFLSMEDELDTAPILRRVLEQGKMLAVPKVVGDDLVFYQIKNISSDTAPGAFGILEPVPGLPEIDVKTLSGLHSVALVPGLARKTSVLGVEKASMTVFSPPAEILYIRLEQGTASSWWSRFLTKPTTLNLTQLYCHPELFSEFLAIVV